MKESTRGGKREGAGRKKGAETKIITFRIRLPWEMRIREVVREEVAKLKAKNK